MEKEANFVNFNNNNISHLKKIINIKIKTELKTLRIELAKHLSESLSWYKEQINIIKEKCKSKDIILFKLSKTV